MPPHQAVATIVSITIRRFLWSFILSLLSASLLSTLAVADGLGPADGFTIFTIESFQANNTNCTGRVAVGGPATYNNFGVGSALENSDGSRNDLIVAGNLTWNSGQNYNGNVQVTGPVTMNNVGMPNGTVGEEVDIDFTSAEIELQTLSESLIAVQPNGSVSNSGGQLMLIGSDLDINVFYVSQSDLNPLKGITISVPQGSSVLVNVDHHSMNLKNFQPILVGCTASDVLFNFPVATSVQLRNIVWEGTILAPRASINFNNGQIYGALICRSVQGNGESHHAPFDGSLPSDDDCVCCSQDDGQNNGDDDNNDPNCICTCDISIGMVLYD